MPLFRLRHFSNKEHCDHRIGITAWARILLFGIQFVSKGYNRVRYFQTLDVVFPKDLFSDYSDITTAVVVPCGGPKVSPYIDIVCYIFNFLVRWDCRIRRLYLGIG